MAAKKKELLRKDGKKDRRSDNATGRTVQFATRVRQEFKEKVDKIRRRDGIMLVELLERSIDLYEDRKKLSRN